MIKVLANKTLYFDRGEKDNHGQLVRVKTKVGDFCTLPDWVGETEYFKLALSDGSLQAFNSNSESKEAAKLFEQKQVLLKEIQELQEQKDLLIGRNDPLADAAENEETEGETEDYPAVQEKTAKKKRGSGKLNPPAYSSVGDTKHVLGNVAPVVFNDTRKGSAAVEDLLEVE